MIARILDGGSAEATTIPSAYVLMNLHVQTLQLQNRTEQKGPQRRQNTRSTAGDNAEFLGGVLVGCIIKITRIYGCQIRRSMRTCVCVCMGECLCTCWYVCVFVRGIFIWFNKWFAVHVNVVSGSAGRAERTVLLFYWNGVVYVDFKNTMLSYAVHSVK